MLSFHKERISAIELIQRRIPLGGELQIDTTNSDFEN